MRDPLFVRLQQCCSVPTPVGRSDQEYCCTTYPLAEQWAALVASTRTAVVQDVATLVAFAPKAGATEPRRWYNALSGGPAIVVLTTLRLWHDGRCLAGGRLRVDARVMRRGSPLNANRHIQGTESPR
jgi:hypothetical protein